MKKLLPVLFFAAAALSSEAQNNEAVAAYIAQYRQLAIDEMIRTGVPASITLAQGILESSAGQSDLTIQSNNHFGIKCKTDWTGNCVYHDDDIKHECFRSYSCAEDSYRDHSDFLKTRPNYASLFDIDATDYKSWAYGLKEAGYATNPVYAISLISTIEKYGLQDVTIAGLQQSHQVIIAAAPFKMQEETAFDNVTGSGAAQMANKEPAEDVATYPDGVFTINRAKVIYAKAGASLLAIANKYNIAYGKLLAFNDLDNGDILSTGMLVYLEKKPKRGSKDYHIALPNENLFAIAQNEGVQLQSLLAYNNLPKNIQLKAGDKIILRTESRKLF
ncbi:glucosaminidase domain-containing protein [Parafilimonas sp.]|uniref:glucosaminidase domain-containing protein n=1 Tax=Parafilimonas sp. TaxID=1969739 RepID=UPI0039E6B748